MRVDTSSAISRGSRERFALTRKRKERFIETEYQLLFAIERFPSRNARQS